MWVLISMMLLCQSSATEFRFARNRIGGLLHSLPGYWAGEAIETPVGPRDYDIYFHPCGDGRVAGVAQTGASLHYWQFSKKDGRLRLEFLSTFAGNRSPVTLIPDGPEEGESLKMFAPAKPLLTLGISFSESQIDIHVFHYGKPHVHIRLKRSTQPLDDNPPHHRRSRSCRKLQADSGNTYHRACC